MADMRRRSLPPPSQTTVPGQRSTFQTIVSLLPYLWPAGNPGARLRVVVALVFMLLAKVATVYVPIVYGHVIDALAPSGMMPMFVVAAGADRRLRRAAHRPRPASASCATPCSPRSQQRAVRLLALRTFRHLHALSLRFHLDRQTGGLSRVIDRGVLGMQSVLRLAVFNVVPTALELVLVTGIIWRLFDWRYAVRHLRGGAALCRLHRRSRRPARPLPPDDERHRQRGLDASRSTAC